MSTRNINEQKSALDFFWYELWMLKQTSDKLIQQEQLDQILKNIYLESFLVHTRNLIDFLDYRNDTRDIRSSDFGVKKMTINLPKGNTLTEINKFLSHLTWDRVGKAKPGWYVNPIIEEIKNKKNIFINQLPDNLFPTPRDGKTKDDFLKI
jgi:hypothetical protein